MKLLRAGIEGFGRLAGLQLTFRPGFNLIFGPNEAGKSTLQHFLRAMLYGMCKPDTRRRLMNDSFERYRPWSGASYGGSLELAFEGGDQFRLERQFRADGAPQAVRLYQLNPLREIRPALDARREPTLVADRLGLSEPAFEGAAWIGQGMLARASGDRDQVVRHLRDALANLIQTGDEALSVERVAAALRERAASEVGTAAAPTRPLAQARIRVEELAGKLAEAQAEREALVERERQIEALERVAWALADELAAAEGELAAAESELARRRLAELDRLAAEIASARAAIAEHSDAASFPLELVPEVDRLLERRAERMRLREQRAEVRQQAEREQAERAAQVQRLQPVLSLGPEAPTQVARDADTVAAWPAADEDWGVEIEQARRRLEALSRAPEEPAMDAAGRLAEAESALARFQARRRRDARLVHVAAALALAGATGAWVAAGPVLGGILALAAVLLEVLLWLSAGTAEGQRGLLEAGVHEVRRAEAEAATRATQAAEREGERDALLARVRLLEQRRQDRAREAEEALARLADAARRLEAAAGLPEAAAALARLPDAALAATAPLVRDLNSGFQAAWRAATEAAQAEALASSVLRRAADDLAAVERDLWEVDEALANALARAGAANADDFRRLVERARRLVAAQTALAELEERWNLVLAADDEVALREKASRNARPEFDLDDHSLAHTCEQLRAKRETLRAQAEQVGRDLDHRRGERNGLYQRIPDTVAVSLELAGARERLQALEFQRRAFDLAIRGLEQTAETMRREFSPRLQAELRLVLSDLTGARYADVQVSDELRMAVRDAGLDRLVEVEQLSAGAADQVYLALRLALTRVIVKEGEVLPVFLDDALVQLDEERMRRALELLVAEADRRQIFFFTCHRREAEAVRELLGDYPPIELA